MREEQAGQRFQHFPKHQADLRLIFAATEVDMEDTAQDLVDMEEPTVLLTDSGLQAVQTT